MLRESGKFVEQTTVNLVKGLFKAGSNETRALVAKELSLRFASSRLGEGVMKYGQAFETTFTPGIPQASKLTSSTVKETLLKLGAGYAGKRAGDKLTE
jgi:hypothetical protein